MSSGRWWHSGASDFYHRLLHTRKWRNLRKQKLGDAIWCEDCRGQGRRELATEVHHLKPVLSGQTESEQAKLCFQYSNLRALCHECHVARHNQSDSRRFRRGRREQSDVKPKSPRVLAQEAAQRSYDSFAMRFFGVRKENE